MGQPVMHFEVMGEDGKALQSFYSEMFGWEFEQPEARTEIEYASVDREKNLGENGEGIGGGIGTHPMGEKHLTFYVYAPDIEAALVRAEELGGERVMGPAEPMKGLTVGLFNDPEGNMVGVVSPSAGD